MREQIDALHIDGHCHIPLFSVVASMQTHRYNAGVIEEDVDVTEALMAMSTTRCTSADRLTSPPRHGFDRLVVVWSSRPLRASGSISVTTTAAPSWANSSAEAAPIPAAAPVTMATFPLSFIGVWRPPFRYPETPYPRSVPTIPRPLRVRHR